VTKKVQARGLIVLLSAVCLASIASAQMSWWRTYGGTGGDVGYSVQQTLDGGYIVAGATGSFGADGDVYLIKTDAQGDTLWTRAYGGTDNDFGYSVQQTSDGGYIFAGLTAGKVSRVNLIKTNASGDTLWTRTCGGADGREGSSIQQTSDGGYIVTDGTGLLGQGSWDVYLVKTNASGDTLWTRIYGGMGHDLGRSVQQTADGGYVVAGYTWSFGAGSSDVYLMKTNASGDTLWARTYGGTGGDVGYSVQQTLDGGYIITGYTASFGEGLTDVYLIKTDAAGDTLWTRTCGGTNWDEAYSVRQTADGGYIVAGRTQSFGTGGEDVYLIKTDASGDTQWTRTCGGSSADAGCSVQQTSDGGYVVAGYTQSFGAGSDDVYLIKTDSLGNVGVAEENPKPQAPHRKIAATVVRSLSPGAVAFDATGRRVTALRSGIFFVRDQSAVTKVLLQR
jgi:hypothetical protein